MTEVSKYWLNSVLDEIEAKYPDGEIVVSSGISPSASYHLGHFREILTSNMLKVGLELRGRRVQHIHVVDNFDPLRKRYDFLPEAYEKYVGWPICLVPDPFECHHSYADHFFQEFYKWVEAMGIEAQVVLSYEDLYQSGRMAEQIEKAIKEAVTARQILNKYRQKPLSEDWFPIQILSSNKSFNEWRFKSIETDTNTIVAYDVEGKEHQVDYSKGEVKLNWRLDWPARWQVLGVMVEPHGFQEHGAAGGSFETGNLLAKDVFGFRPPLAGIQYGHVHLAGDNIKMSSSKGNTITPEEAFKIMPPEIIKYFYARYPGKKKIDFDPGLGLFRMYDEYVAVESAVLEKREHEFAPAYQLSVAGDTTKQVSTVPFSHLVTVYQATLGSIDKVLELLKRSGFAKQVENEAQVIEKELEYVKNWLETRAPEEVKFGLAEKLDDNNLSLEQKQFLAKLADKIEATDELDAQAYHTAIHDTAKELGLESNLAFQAIYGVLLNKNHGPKAGMFLALLEKQFLIDRFRLKH